MCQENRRLPLPCLGGASQPTLHRARVHQTCLLELKSAVGEHREVRNALDVVSSRKLRVLLCVDLDHDSSPREISSDLSNMGRGHPAWATPRSPEIDEDRDFAFANNFVKLRGADLDGFSQRG